MEFRELIDIALYSFRVLAADHFFYQIKAMAVDGNTEGATLASTIAERARSLLTDPVMSVTGKTLLYCRFERSIPDFEEWDADKSRFIYHNGGIFELWLA